MIKICNDCYDYGCSNFADYTTEEELSRVFRKVYNKKNKKTYCFRNVCKECEAKNRKMRDDDKQYNTTNRFYDTWDYGEVFGNIKIG